MTANMVNTKVPLLGSTNLGSIPSVTVEGNGTTKDKPPERVNHDGGSGALVQETRRKKPPLERGFSRNKSDPKLLPVIIIICSIYDNNYSSYASKTHEPGV